MTDTTALQMGLASCHGCHKLSPASEHACPRCGAALHLRNTDSLHRTFALLITAIILYIPANLYPIMVTEQIGSVPINSTIIGGVVLLIQLNSIPIALVIFIASVIVPLAKIVALCYLAWSVQRHQIAHRQRTRLYLVAEFVGKWSMVDVFVVAILVALIQLSGILVISPGIATYSFAGVVLVTMIAAECFDTRLMWDEEEDNGGSET